MRKYKIQYFFGNRSIPYYIAQLSKSEKLDGLRISFSPKGWVLLQDSWNKDFANGIDKEWKYNSENHVFSNWKKHKLQGVNISFI